VCARAFGNDAKPPRIRRRAAPRLRHASVVGAEIETKKESRTEEEERKREEEVNVNRGIQPNLYRPAVIF